MEDPEYYINQVNEYYPALLELVILAKAKRRWEGKGGFTVILICSNGHNAEVLWEEEERRFTECTIRYHVGLRVMTSRIIIPKIQYQS